MTVKAPSVTSLRIVKLSANHVHIKWDDVGANFYYFVELANTRTSEGVSLDPSRYQWRNLGYTSENEFFESGFIRPNDYYVMRVSVAAQGFERSNWVQTEEFQTFLTNAYTFQSMLEMTLANKFIREKFTNNNQSYVDFNRDTVMAALMDESFQFSPNYEIVSSISDHILFEEEYHEIQSSISAVCKDINRVMLMESEGILYLFERFQPVVKVSNNRGQTWQAVKLLNDRVGNPVSRTVYYQSEYTTYLLGYDRIFYGRKSNDIRWSSDEVRFSSQDVTFAKIGDQLKLGFDVEIFGTYASLPADVSRIAEAITTTDDFIYVVARDKVRFAKTRNAPIDQDPLSPTFGEKLFEPEVLTITGNPKAVCYKMEAVNGKVFALITGEVKEDRMDPTVPENVIDSQSKGIYILQSDNTFKRVFGNTEEERRRIEHGYTSMSTNGTEVFISSSNFKFLNDQIVQDPDTALKYDLLGAVKYEFPREWLSDKHYHMMSFRADEKSGYEQFVPGAMNYYAEPFFSWSRKSGTRCWINNSDRIVVVYSNITHTKIIDTHGSGSPERVLHEFWDKGTCTVTAPNVEFNGFTKYASGILFYKSSGEIISYYEFNYRVRDETKIIWKPSEIFLKAYLQNQERETEWKPEERDGIQDPDLRPLIRTMMPDSYLLEDTNFEKFCDAYIQYLSDGYGTQYNNLLNLIRNQYPREKDSWEYLWSEVYKRNIYLNKDKRDAVSRFFEARRSDFYSTKGIEASYKFLFKLLYNEDVEIEIESNSGTEYDIVIESDSINEDLVGQTIYTPTGRCNVTYIERSYSKGKLQWNVTIHNLLGRLIQGQEVKAERYPGFNGMIVRGVRGKELVENTIDYINRNRSYYVMKIRSNLPTSRYRNDVLRFVHPVGFGFIGITLLTMFINVGLTMKHVQTIINKYKNYKWDAGIPTFYPDRVASLDSSGNVEKDPVTGEVIYLPGPMSGIAYPVPADYDSENDNSIFQGQTPTERRKSMSPLFDQSAVTFSQFRDLVEQRLIDKTGLPREPNNPTQVKIDE
ncbi:baseplate wedge subunit [Salmonella phage STP4-a]|uniref:Baseplate wedge protein gp7 n=1 Tax=Salmonella phage STP4-a TaxID=1445860 RepID=A0A0B4L9I6_9CAUD|nr:baseplate wedge subunit [Salmonella phage STP4-a]AHJ86996.1 baseplate wedge subunit [Salmonella phage STP4-a]